MTYNAEYFRKKYFEKYVTFEIVLRKLLQAMNKKTKNKSLTIIIEEIASSPKFASLMLQKNKLLYHKQLRNWLAHSHANGKASKKQKNDFKKIDKIILEIINTTNTTKKIKKKRHPRRGRAI